MRQMWFCFKKSHEKVTFLQWKCSVMLIWHDRYFNVCINQIFVFLCIWSSECAASHSFTSRALPTWQVFLSDQLEASNTITLPPPRDTQSWPENTHIHTLHHLFSFIFQHLMLHPSASVYSSKPRKMSIDQQLWGIFLSVQQTGRRQLASKLDVKRSERNTEQEGV